MKKNQLQSNQIDFLVQHYRITMEKNNHPLSFQCSKLLDQEFVANLINGLKDIYQVTGSFVIASQFMKRYGFMVTVPYLYSLSVWNKELDIDPKKVTFQSFEQDGNWIPKLYLKSFMTTSPEDYSRVQWRQNAIEKLFKYHLGPVIKIFARQGKVTRQMLWENTAIYIFWLYESLMEQFPENRQIKEDFTYLLEEDGSLFGNYTYNPISKFYTKKRYIPQKDANIRVRKTCCLYNRLPGVEDSCTTCPQTCKIVQKRGDEVCG
jgi:ferric iron reductase protein FhuF